MEQRLVFGQSLRDKVKRSEHDLIDTTKKRPSVATFIKESNEGRIESLLPIRAARLAQSPMSFMRGMAGIMAHDLHKTPNTGYHIRICGDCHLANFGGFGTPERNQIFDINDFDENFIAPWEWDIKRLAASFFVQGRELGFSDKFLSDVVINLSGSYKNRLKEFSVRPILSNWYNKIDATALLENSKSKSSLERRQKLIEKGQAATYQHITPKIISSESGNWKFVDEPPLVYHPDESFAFIKRIDGFFNQYVSSLSEDKQFLLHKYEYKDTVVKVTGVGSAAKRCAVLLFVDENNFPLLLQVKEANASVHQPHLKKKPVYEHHGRRIVTGQRIMQSASDIFLGWATDTKGHDYYFRQLRDMKVSAPIDDFNKEMIFNYAELCGWALASAHSKSGDPIILSSYLGKSDVFDNALAKFAKAYADINEKDYESYMKIYNSGK